MKKQQLRAIGFGLLAAMVTISVVEAIGNSMYPAPADMDYNNKEMVKALISSMPFGALVFVVNAWILGSFIGSIVTSRMYAEGTWKTPVITGMLVLVFTMMNMLMIPHPIWMWVSGLLGIVPAAWFGHTLTQIQRRYSNKQD